jgi:hypothetical protein
MKLEKRHFFINNTKNDILLNDDINYETFVKMTLNEVPFRRVFNNDNIITEELMPHKSFFYGLYNYLQRDNLILSLYWIKKYYNTRRIIASRNKKIGTISNFVYQNPDIKYKQSEFSRVLKYFYILNKFNLLGLVIKRNHVPHINISKEEIDQIIENSTIDNLIHRIMDITKNYSVIE